VPRFDPTPAGSGPQVRGFAGTQFMVDVGRFDAVLLTPERATAWSPPARAELTLEDLEPLLELEPAPEFLLFGSGATLARPPRALVDQLAERGIGVEVMDSRSAARTWGVLRAEDRWIAAALMPL
jgi:uncharacterized protein